MTTNVYDFRAGLLASDSRWSGRVDDYLFFVDDVRYEKIVFDSMLALLFAGNLDIIEIWKAWFRGGRYGHPPHVNQNLSMCIIDLQTGLARKDHGIKLLSPCTYARFAGTGSPHALQCWTTNQNAIQSVETACGLDMMSGGKVAYLDRQSRSNNLENVSPVEHVMDAFLPRGEMIMMKGNQKQTPVPIKEAIKDPAANQAFQKMMGNGSAGVCAPFIGMGTPWTQEEKDDLYAILAEYPPEPK
jgi:hypothetical protein